MNWLLLIVLAVIGYHTIDGLRHGFIKKSVTALSLIVTLVLVSRVTPYISGFIQESTPVYHSVREACIEMFRDEEYNENIKTEQVQAIEKMKLPECLKSILIENNNHEVYDVLEVSGFYEYIGTYLAEMIIHALSFVIGFVVVWTVLRVLIAALNIITMLPVLNGLNRLAGGVLGFAMGIVIVWIGFLGITIFCNGEVGQWFFEEVQSNTFLSILYNSNIVLKAVIGLIVK